MLVKFSPFIQHTPKINEPISLILRRQEEEILLCKVLESSVNWRNELVRKWWLLSCMYFTYGAQAKAFLKTVNFGTILLSFFFDLSENAWRHRVLWPFCDVLKHLYSKSHDVGKPTFQRSWGLAVPVWHVSCRSLESVQSSWYVFCLVIS